MTLGDWLRKNYVAIGWDEGSSQNKDLKEKKELKTKIIVPNGAVWCRFLEGFCFFHSDCIHCDIRRTKKRMEKNEVEG